jgi:hypothetical protein
VAAFPLKRGEEALGDGVVVRVASGAHRDSDASVVRGLTEAEADVLPGLNRSSQQCVGEMNLRIASDGCAGLGRGDSVWGGGAAVVAEARPEGGPERR